MIILLSIVLLGLITLLIYIIIPSPGTIFNNVSFKNISDFKNSKWSKYFKSVYHGDPDPDDFPLNITDFDILYTNKLKAAGITDYTATSGCPTKKNELYKDMSISWDPPNTIRLWKPPPYNSIPSNTWIEIVHCSNGKNENNQSVGNWMYVSTGSGIYFNTGKTIAFNDHPDAVKYFLKTDQCKGSSVVEGSTYKGECNEQFDKLFTAAKNRGYDSVQFLKHGDQRCGLSAAEIIDVNGNTNYGCGDANPNSPGFRKRYKTGWKATKSCDCKVQSNPYSGCLNC